MTSTTTEALTPTALARDIAESLGPTWKVAEVSGETFRLALPNPNTPQELFCDRVGGYQNAGRIEIRPVWPRIGGKLYSPVDHLPADECEHIVYSITVALSRGPEVIAREIDRRLLPTWFPTFARLVRLGLTRKAATDERRKRVSDYAKMLGETLDLDRQSDRDYPKVSFTVGETYGYVDARSIEVRCLTDEQMRSILEVVAGFRGEVAP